VERTLGSVAGGSAARENDESTPVVESKNRRDSRKKRGPADPKQKEMSKSGGLELKEEKGIHFNNGFPKGQE